MVSHDRTLYCDEETTYFICAIHSRGVNSPYHPTINYRNFVLATTVCGAHPVVVSVSLSLYYVSRNIDGTFLQWKISIMKWNQSCIHILTHWMDHRELHILKAKLFLKFLVLVHWDLLRYFQDWYISLYVTTMCKRSLITPASLLFLSKLSKGESLVFSEREFSSSELLIAFECERRNQEYNDAPSDNLGVLSIPRVIIYCCFLAFSLQTPRSTTGEVHTFVQLALHKAN